MKLSTKDQIAITLLDANKSMKGGELRASVKDRFNRDLLPGDLSTAIKGNLALFAITGEKMHYDYSLTPAGEDHARTSKAMAETNSAAPIKSRVGRVMPVADMAMNVLRFSGTPIGSGAIAELIFKTYGRKVTSTDVAGALGRDGETRFTRSGIRGSYVYQLSQDGEASATTEGGPIKRTYTRSSQWTLTLVNGTQQIAATVSSSAVRKIVNTILFARDQHEQEEQ